MSFPNMNLNKKKIVSLAVIVILLAILGGSTLAYFADQATAHNVIASGGIAIEIIEKTRGDNGTLLDFPKDGITGVMPGTSVSKIVTVKNTGTAPAWIRISVEQYIVDPQNNPLPDTLDDETPVMSISMDLDYWTEKDGWWYYAKAVPADEITEVLFQEVQFSPWMGNEYQNCKANILVSAQAVQSQNNGTSVLTAQGWPKA